MNATTRAYTRPAEWWDKILEWETTNRNHHHYFSKLFLFIIHHLVWKHPNTSQLQYLCIGISTQGGETPVGILRTGEISIDIGIEWVIPKSILVKSWNVDNTDNSSSSSSSIEQQWWLPIRYRQTRRLLPKEGSRGLQYWPCQRKQNQVLTVLDTHPPSKAMPGLSALCERSRRVLPISVRQIHRGRQRPERQGILCVLRRGILYVV